MNNSIELLAPAKNAAIGIEAIRHGADAVYIGAPMFSARAAAGNTLEDIATLVDFAHSYHARVYVALNTILRDDELPAAETLIHALYAIGVDALIIQDMGILRLDLPPIAIHASTQCDNRSLDKVRFFEANGFEQVVLARELSLAQIAEIAQNVSLRIECFVHGALCVSYSGQCYMSQAVAGRSANRGTCSQMCRLAYDLIDGDDHVLIENKHLLSLKDLDASDHLGQMIDAGVRSFKIEGRLKDVNYVKNITGYYRQKLDALIEERGLYRASSGRTHLAFTPNPKKSFFRGATDYFLDGRNTTMASHDTPKALGEPVGQLRAIRDGALLVDSSCEFNNGDGLCGYDRDGLLVGFRVNRSDGATLYPHGTVRLPIGAQLYRNVDAAFDRLLERADSAERKIALRISLAESAQGLLLTAEDEDGCRASLDVSLEKEAAKNPERAYALFAEQLSKLGNTIFVAEVDIRLDEAWFVPTSRVAEWRRALIDGLEAARRKAFRRSERRTVAAPVAFPQRKLDYRGNVYNAAARRFYTDCGVSVEAAAFEAQPVADAELMRTKYCLKYALGCCPKQQPKQPIVEPLMLLHEQHRFRLQFDCKACEMVVIKA